MKKKKLFEVSLINKAYSRIIQNTTRFYTSDTALEIGFDIVELEYSFDSAIIILLNENDRSLVTRELTRNGKGFTYELESDIIEHYGNWAAQLKLEKDSEVYISSPVGFSIENDLYNSRPPKLSEVNTWKNLRATADGLIDDIRNELELVAEKELDRELSESERQSAELLRIENENQRKTDHDNRSAELASKANKKQEDWITATLINGAVGTVQYRKDGFGMVHIQGSVSIPNSSLQPFLIPFGYRPRQTFSNAVTTINNNNVYKFTVGASGSSFLNTANIVVDLTGVNFEAGG